MKVTPTPIPIPTPTLTRLRVRDLRRHPFLTHDGAEPLEQVGEERKSAAKAELRDWGHRVIVQNR